MFYSVFGNLYYRCFGDPVEDQAVITAKQAVEVLESGMNKMGKIEIKIGGQ
jgi:hypothetical protein